MPEKYIDEYGLNVPIFTIEEVMRGCWKNIDDLKKELDEKVEKGEFVKVRLDDGIDRYGVATNEKNMTMRKLFKEILRLQE